jgi:branched-chain amino acid transport system substrate-binding protein
MVRAAGEVGLKAKLFGGGMVGLQATAIKTQLGPALNGIVNYDFWIPVPTMQFPGVNELIKRYQEKAPVQGVDVLGYYMVPWAYAQLQVLGDAIAATKSLDDAKLADYIHATTFKTVVGDVKFGSNGEWAEPRVVQVQFHDIKDNSVDQFRTMGTQTVVAPAAYASGKVIYPFTDARK